MRNSLTGCWRLCVDKTELRLWGWGTTRFSQERLEKVSPYFPAREGDIAIVKYSRAPTCLPNMEGIWKGNNLQLAEPTAPPAGVCMKPSTGEDPSDGSSSLKTDTVSTLTISVKAYSQRFLSPGTSCVAIKRTSQGTLKDTTWLEEAEQHQSQASWLYSNYQTRN